MEYSMASSEAAGAFRAVPVEIVGGVLAFLSPHTLTACCRVSKSWRDLARIQLYQSIRYPHDLHEKKSVPAWNWRYAEPHGRNRLKELVDTLKLKSSRHLRLLVRKLVVLQHVVPEDPGRDDPYGSRYHKQSSKELHNVIAKLVNLQHLKVTPYSLGHDSDAYAAAIASLPNLRSLYPSPVQWSSRIEALYLSLPPMETLDFSLYNVSNMPVLAGILEAQDRIATEKGGPFLRTLRLRDMRVSQLSMDCSAPHLHTLTLGYQVGAEPAGLLNLLRSINPGNLRNLAFACERLDEDFYAEAAQYTRSVTSLAMLVRAEGEKHFRQSLPMLREMPALRFVAMHGCIMNERNVDPRYPNRNLSQYGYEATVGRKPDRPVPIVDLNAVDEFCNALPASLHRLDLSAVLLDKEGIEMVAARFPEIKQLTVNGPDVWLEDLTAALYQHRNLEQFYCIFDWHLDKFPAALDAIRPFPPNSKLRHFGGGLRRALKPGESRGRYMLVRRKEHKGIRPAFPGHDRIRDKEVSDAVIDDLITLMCQEI